MLKPVHHSLEKLDGYLLKIERNTDTGKYELDIGIPNTWAYKSTKKIKCDIIHETDSAKLIRISTEEEDLYIDDLIVFVNIIIDTNQRIMKMQEEFEKRMEDTKLELQKKVEGFYDELEQVKETSFSLIDKNKEMSEKEEFVVEDTEKTEDEKKQEVLDKIPS